MCSGDRENTCHVFPWKDCVEEVLFLPAFYILCLGASLAQDRGRLESRIEVLLNDLESQKKQNERDNDALRIKAKILDDQTETIRKLKEVLFVYKIRMN